jgi:hypothetical protein
MKVKSMEEWLIPKDIKGLRGFLGLIRYYRKFVKHYGIIARSLTHLPKKNSFHWGEKTMKAFQELKRVLMELPMLSMSNFHVPFEMEPTNLQLALELSS